MKSRHTQTGSAHIVIIIVLIVALVGTLGFVFWQNFIQKKDNTATATTTSTTKTAAVDPYAGWQTYSNKELGFSIKYPADWKLDTSKDSSFTVASFASPDIKSELQGAPVAPTSDVTIETEPITVTSSTASTSPVSALLASDSTGYAYQKYTDTINGLSATEFDMISLTGYFAALFRVGNNYIEVAFPTAATKANLSTTSKAILASFTAL